MRDNKRNLTRDNEFDNQQPRVCTVLHVVITKCGPEALLGATGVTGQSYSMATRSFKPGYQLHTMSLGHTTRTVQTLMTRTGVTVLFRRLSNSCKSICCLQPTYAPVCE
jgi:hypothetical protein